MKIIENLKGKIKDYFSFTKSERIGTIILVSLILISVIIPNYLKYKNAPDVVDEERFKLEVKEFLKDSLIDSTINKNTPSFYTEKRLNKKRKYQPEPFDPNSLDIKGWIKMGFSEKQAEVIIKYRQMSGGFINAEHFGKIYIIDDEVYHIFKPFIKIDSNFTKSDNSVKTYPKSSRQIVQVELNSADSIELLRIRGIGPVFAHRIIQYREQLQGYANLNQLIEVYGMDTIRLNSLIDQIIIDPLLIKKIDINRASLIDLRSHPYISYYVAKAIIDRRVQYGNYNNLDEMRSISMITEELYYKLEPYLTVE